MCISLLQSKTVEVEVSIEPEWTHVEEVGGSFVANSKDDGYVTLSGIKGQKRTFKAYKKGYKEQTFTIDFTRIIYAFELEKIKAPKKKKTSYRSKKSGKAEYNTQIWECGVKYSNANLKASCKDGLAEGSGSYTIYPRPGIIGESYKGSFKAGKKEGYGEQVRELVGYTYIGYFKNNWAHGKGKKIFLNGNVHEGEFKSGFLTGQGTLVKKNGEKYRGGFRVGKFHGSGHLTYPSGTEFIGQFSKGSIIDGQATYIFPKTTNSTKPKKYVGSINAEHLRMYGITGYGTMWLNNGDKLVGNFVKGKRDGLVKEYSSSGEWKGTVKFNQGTFVKVVDRPAKKSSKRSKSSYRKKKSNKTRRNDKGWGAVYDKMNRVEKDLQNTINKTRGW